MTTYRCAEGVSAKIGQLQDMPAKAYPRLIQPVLGNQTVVISDISPLPPEAALEKKILNQQQIKAVLLLPVKIGGKIRGFLGLENTSTNVNWNPNDIVLLRVNYLNPIAEAMTGWPLDEALNHPARKTFDSCY